MLQPFLKYYTKLLKKEVLIPPLKSASWFIWMRQTKRPIRWQYWDQIDTSWQPSKFWTNYLTDWVFSEAIVSTWILKKNIPKYQIKTVTIYTCSQKYRTFQNKVCQLWAKLKSVLHCNIIMEIKMYSQRSFNTIWEPTDPANMLPEENFMLLIKFILFVRAEKIRC